jgi:hypothetical protein
VQSPSSDLRFRVKTLMGATHDWVMTLREYPRRVLADGAQTLTELELPSRAMLLLKEEMA